MANRRRRESALEARCVKAARAKGVVVAKLALCDGVPDRVFFVPGGAPLIVEFKASGSRPEELQSWYLKTLVRAGYKAVYCESWGAFKELMGW